MTSKPKDAWRAMTVEYDYQSIKLVGCKIERPCYISPCDWMAMWDEVMAKMENFDVKYRESSVYDSEDEADDEWRCEGDED